MRNTPSASIARAVADGLSRYSTKRDGASIHNSPDAPCGSAVPVSGSQTASRACSLTGTPPPRRRSFPSAIENSACTSELP